MNSRKDLFTKPSFRNEPNKIHLLFDSKESRKNILSLSFSAEHIDKNLNFSGHYPTLIIFIWILIWNDSLDPNRLRASANKGLQYLKLFSVIHSFFAPVWRSGPIF